MSKPTLTTRQVCEILQVSRKTLYRWVITGKIPKPIKINRAVRWRQEIIEQILAGEPTPAQA